MPIYDATKAGLVSLAKSLAMEHAKDHIRVNAVCPRFTVADFHIKKAKEEGRSCITVPEYLVFSRRFSCDSFLKLCKGNVLRVKNRRGDFTPLLREPVAILSG